MDFLHEIITLVISYFGELMHQSNPSANISPGNFFEVVKSPAPWQKFSAKAQRPGQENTDPRDKRTPTPGEYFERPSQLFLMIGVEILEFCRNQT